jgi:hypothetical protein
MTSSPKGGESHFAGQWLARIFRDDADAKRRQCLPAPGVHQETCILIR